MKNYRLVFLFIFILQNSLCGFAQENKDDFPVFKSGEKIKYNAVYNWGLIWLNAGTVEFKVTDIKYKNAEAYHFSCYGTSLKSYDWFFKVRDYFQSYVNKETLYPYFFERNTYEDGYSVHDIYQFDYNDSLLYTKTKNSNKPYSEDTIKLRPQTHDLISSVYFARNIDFDKYKINETIPFRITLENEFYDLHIRYLGKENIITHDNRQFKTIKFSVLLIEGTIFKKGEDLYVWVTDDLNRIPVLVDAKILIGSVKATLVSTENLKFPLSSEIK